MLIDLIQTSHIPSRDDEGQRYSGTMQRLARLPLPNDIPTGSGGGVIAERASNKLVKAGLLHKGCELARDGRAVARREIRDLTLHVLELTEKFARSLQHHEFGTLDIKRECLIIMTRNTLTKHQRS